MRRRPSRETRGIHRRRASTLASSSSCSVELPWPTFQEEQQKSLAVECNQQSCNGNSPLLHHPVYPHRPLSTHVHLGGPPSQHLHTENIPLNGYGNQIDDELETLCRKGLLDLAFTHLDELVTPPSHNTLVVFLKACVRLRSLSHAKSIHAYLLRHQIPLQGSLGEHLVSALAKCGSLHDACALLESLPCRTSLSWSSLISSLVDQGHPNEALRMYERMVKDGVRATGHTFTTLFKACGNAPNPEQGRKLHMEAHERGFTASVFVGNCLMSMYRKFGSFIEVEEVFNELPCRDHVSWNSMLSAYLDQGEGEKAMLLFRQMRTESWHPNPQTCVLVLQACALLADRDEAKVFLWKDNRFKYSNIVQALHADAKRFGFDRHPFVGTTLVTLYSKCGTIVEAEHVSSSIPDQDLVSWTAMFSAYGHQGHGIKALQLYKKMLEEGMNPDSRAFAIALQACEALVQEDSSTKAVAFQTVQALHNDAWNKGFASDVILGSLLVVLYSKCGTIRDAELVFCELPHRDFTVWTALMSAYVDEGQGVKAVLLYRQMLAEGVTPDNLSFATALQASATLDQAEEANQPEGRSIKVRSLHISQGLHVDARRRGFASDTYVTNMLISSYSKCGAITEAENVFMAVSQPDATSWLKILTAYLDQGHGEGALRLFKFMQERGTHPNAQIFVVAIQACGLIAMAEETVFVEGSFVKMRSLEFGQALFADAKRTGYDLDVFVATALVNLLGKCGSIEDAENVCAALSKPDLVLWTAMLSAYIEQGQGEKALELYRKMQSNCLLALDDVITVCILQACGKTGNLEMARDLHFAIGFSALTVEGFLASVLAFAYGSCASIADLQATLDVLVEPDLVTFNACIAGYAGEGNLSASEQLAQAMQLQGCKPDGVTFVSLLSACSHVGLINMGLELVESLYRDHQLSLDLRHYSTLLDLLGRAGDFGRIERLLQRMPMQADLAIWLCLLGACRIHGNVTVARQAFDMAVSVQPNEAAPYILMSRIYLEGGMQGLAEEVDKLRPQMANDGMAWPELD